MKKLLMMKAEKEETTCLLEIEEKDCVRTSVKVPVKGITDKLPFQEPVIKGGKGKKKLPDGLKKGHCPYGSKGPEWIL